MLSAFHFLTNYIHFGLVFMWKNLHTFLIEMRLEVDANMMTWSTYFFVFILRPIRGTNYPQLKTEQTCELIFPVEFSSTGKQVKPERNHVIISHFVVVAIMWSTFSILTPAAPRGTVALWVSIVEIRQNLMLGRYLMKVCL